MNPRSFTVSGIVLRLADLGESDRFVTLLTPDRGKITCVGKNLRTMKSRRNTQLELMNRIQVKLWRSRNSHYLSECNLEERFGDLKQNLKSMASGTFIIEATERLTAEEHLIPHLYDLLEQTLSLMDFYPNKHELLREAYLIKLLNLIGTIASFRTCSECHDSLPKQDAFLDENHSTIHCEACAKKNRSHLRRIPLETLKLMHFLLSHPIPATLKLRITREHLNIIDEFGRTFLRHDLRYPLKSEAFLNTY
jgi:DNA repair protein RecO (recombination protein O)